MADSLRNKRILVLGGTGLVGRNTVLALMKQGARHIGVVGLKNGATWKKLGEIEHNQKVKIKKYKNDLMIPSQFGRYSFEKITSQKNNSFARVLAAGVKKDEIKKETLYKIIVDFRPDFIVDSINTATQCSYINTHSRVIDGVGIGLLLLLRYYQVLYHLLRQDFWKEKKKKVNILQYIKIGTTGIGGMGLGIPFTHGEEQPSLSLLKKVAMAGSQTNILFAMSNSRNIANIQEIIPATSIFQLSGFDAKRKEIDGGESRGYALEEFRLLTDKRLMGVIDAFELAEIIVDALKTGKSRFDALGSLMRARVARSSKSSAKRRDTSQTWQEDQNKQKAISIAHGNLGPRRIRKLLFELFILLDFYQTHTTDFWHFSPRKIQEHITTEISENTSLQKEMKLADMRVSASSSKKSSDIFINLSTKNLARWRNALESLGLKKKRTFVYAGDILAQLIEKRNDLKIIP